MRFLDRVYLVIDRLTTAPPSEVVETAARLGLTFPDGYADYVTELGAGELSGYLRIWLPRKVEAELAEHRRRYAENFFWRDGGPLTHERTRDLVVLGGTIEGDDLAFHPDRPDELFVLPRHRDRTYRIGSTLDDAIEWLCDSGELIRPITARYFEPVGDRERIERSIARPYQDVRDALVGLGIHDLVGFEERPGDEEKVFEAYVKVGDHYEEVEDEEAAIMLLIREIGGDVTAMTGSGFDADSTDVTITHLGGPTSPKLDRLLSLLDELEGRRRRRKR